MTKNIFNWINSHKLETTILLFIITFSAFLRLYRINEYMTFLGDEGRDARVVYKLLTQRDIVLIGPMTSVSTSSGNMYLGPLYYYLMAPAMLFANFSPVGPAVLVALISLLTIGLLWWIGRSWWHPVAGLIAATFYAISPTIIIYSRSSWNPNIMPFFALLSIWSIYNIWSESQKLKMWFLILGISMAFVLQSHYLGLLLFPTIGLFWLAKLVHLKRNSKKTKPYFLYSGFCILIFLLLMSPLLVFDLRHDWLNFKAMYAFFSERQTTVNFKFYKGFKEIYPLTIQIFSSMLTNKNILTLGLGAIVIIWALIKELLDYKKNLSRPLVLVIVWLFIGILGLSLYKQTIYDHYFGFLYPVPFLLIGWAYWRTLATTSSIKSTIIGPIIILTMLQTNLKHHPLSVSPNNQLQKATQVSKKIMESSNNLPFNLALIARQNYDEGYRFILEKQQSQLVAIDPQNASQTITEQLFVICENSEPFQSREEDCDPISHPRSEIALFGWAKVEQEWIFPWGHRLYKLIHTQPQSPQ